MVIVGAVVLLVVSVASVMYFGKSSETPITNNGGVEMSRDAVGNTETGEEVESEEAEDSDEAVVTNTNTSPVVTKTAVTKDPISLDTIAMHSKAEDCWMAIEGKVYDMTPYIQKQIHPGGAALLLGCGKDSTVIFNLRPQDNKSHSPKARSYLTNYYIGELAK